MFKRGSSYQMEKQRQDLWEANRETIHSMLAGIASKWGTHGDGSCSHAANRKTKRFKHLIDVKGSRIGLILWEGTSNYIDCQSTEFPREDDFWKYEKDTNDMEVNILVSISPHKGSEFLLTVSDTIELLSEDSREIHLVTSTIGDVLNTLEGIQEMIV